MVLTRNRVIHNGFMKLLLITTRQHSKGQKFNFDIQIYKKHMMLNLVSMMIRIRGLLLVAQRMAVLIGSMHFGQS
jgi:hypothetical protein